jgi:hypothetical protein
MKLMSFTKKKAVACGLAFGVAAGAGGIAAAYYTTSGTGTGAAHTGTPTPFQVTVQRVSTATLTPTQPGTGDYATDVQEVRWVIKNNGPNVGHQYLGKVVISVTPAFAAQATATLPACTAATFSLNGLSAGTSVTVTVAAVTAPTGPTLNAGEQIFTTVAVRLINNGANQDNCENVSVPIHVAAS